MHTCRVSAKCTLFWYILGCKNRPLQHSLQIVPQCKVGGKVITIHSILIPCIFIKYNQHCFTYKCSIARNQHLHLPIFSLKYIITSQKISTHTKTIETRWLFFINFFTSITPTNLIECRSLVP